MSYYTPSHPPFTHHLTLSHTPFYTPLLHTISHIYSFICLEIKIRQTVEIEGENMSYYTLSHTPFTHHLTLSHTPFYTPAHTLSHIYSFI